MTILIYSAVALFVLLVANIIIRIISGKNSFPWLQFIIRGLESGFRLGEIRSLHKVVQNTKLRDPLSVYWSKKSILKCIATLEDIFSREKKGESPKDARFLRKFFNLLNRLDVLSQQKKIGIRSTRDIAPQIPLKLSILNKQYESQVIENNYRYLIIANPQKSNIEHPEAFPSNVPISVNFWRKNDSGYNFTSRILSDTATHDVDVIHLQHSRRLKRTVNRAFPRKIVNAKGILRAFQKYNDFISTKDDTQALKCRVIDISENGLSVMIGGKVSLYRFFIIDTDYCNMRLNFNAQLRRSQYDKDRNVSLLNLEAFDQNINMRNSIALIVYDICHNDSELTPSSDDAHNDIHISPDE